MLIFLSRLIIVGAFIFLYLISNSLFANFVNIKQKIPNWSFKKIKKMEEVLENPKIRTDIKLTVFERIHEINIRANKTEQKKIAKMIIKLLEKNKDLKVFCPKVVNRICLLAPRLNKIHKSENLHSETIIKKILHQNPDDEEIIQNCLFSLGRLKHIPKKAAKSLAQILDKEIEKPAKTSFQIAKIGIIIAALKNLETRTPIGVKALIKVQDSRYPFWVRKEAEYALHKIFEKSK